MIIFNPLQFGNLRPVSYTGFHLLMLDIRDRLSELGEKLPFGEGSKIIAEQVR